MIEIGKNYKIKEHVTHQGIGGREINIERELSVVEMTNKAYEGNVACINFVNRRIEEDNVPGCYEKLYYGHVGNLGYVVCEDELYE